MVAEELVKVYFRPRSKNGVSFISGSEDEEGRNIILSDVVIVFEEISRSFLVCKGDDLYLERNLDLKTALTEGRIILRNFLKEAENLAIYKNVYGD